MLELLSGQSGSITLPPTCVMWRFKWFKGLPCVRLCGHYLVFLWRQMIPKGTFEFRSRDTKVMRYRTKSENTGQTDFCPLILWLFCLKRIGCHQEQMVQTRCFDERIITVHSGEDVLPSTEISSQVFACVPVLMRSSSGHSFLFTLATPKPHCEIGCHMCVST